MSTFLKAEKEGDGVALLRFTIRTANGQRRKGNRLRILDCGIQRILYRFIGLISWFEYKESGLQNHPPFKILNAKFRTYCPLNNAPAGSSWILSIVRYSSPR